MLAGSCGSDVDIPYEPFATALVEAAGLDPVLGAAVRSQAGLLARSFPSSGSLRDGAQPALARIELFDAVADLLIRLTRIQPVMLVLDDLQWATAASVQLLSHLIQQLGTARLLIVGTHRVDLDSGHSLRSLLSPAGPSQRTATMSLTALTQDDVLQMVISLVPGTPIGRASEIAKVIRRESGGSPFFASELLIHLSAIGALDQVTDAAPAERLPIPESVHNVVQQRCDGSDHRYLRPSRSLGLGAAGRALADPQYSKAIVRAAKLARTAGHPEIVARAAALSTWPGTFFFVAEVPNYDLIQLCEDAVEMLGERDPMRARIMATLASHLTFASTAEQRQALIAQATTLAAEHRDPVLTADVLNAEFLCLWEPGTLARREQIARDLSRIGRATGDP